MELAALNPAKEGEFRVFNQFTEAFSVMDLAHKVQEAGEAMGLAVTIAHIENPRIEKETHYYNPKNTALFSLGLKHHPLTQDVITGMLKKIMSSRDAIDRSIINPTIKWRKS